MTCGLPEENSWEVTELGCNLTPTPTSASLATMLNSLLRQAGPSPCGPVAWCLETWSLTLPLGGRGTGLSHFTSGFHILTPKMELLLLTALLVVPCIWRPWWLQKGFVNSVPSHAAAVLQRGKWSRPRTCQKSLPMDCVYSGGCLGGTVSPGKREKVCACSFWRRDTAELGLAGAGCLGINAQLRLSSRAGPRPGGWAQIPTPALTTEPVTEPLCAAVSPICALERLGAGCEGQKSPERLSQAQHLVGVPWTVVSVPFLFHQPTPGPGPLSPPAWQALWDRVSQRRRTSRLHT